MTGDRKRKQQFSMSMSISTVHSTSIQYSTWYSTPWLSVAIGYSREYRILLYSLYILLKSHEKE